MAPNLHGICKPVTFLSGTSGDAVEHQATTNQVRARDYNSGESDIDPLTCTLVSFHYPFDLIRAAPTAESMTISPPSLGGSNDRVRGGCFSPLEHSNSVHDTGRDLAGSCVLVAFPKLLVLDPPRPAGPYQPHLTIVAVGPPILPIPSM